MSLLNNPLLYSSLLQSNQNLNNINNISTLSTLLNNPLMNNLLDAFKTLLNTKNNNNKEESGISLKNIDEEFFEFKHYESNGIGSNIVYVEGIPLDAKEREIAHIFRPFPGYISLRLRVKIKNDVKSILCFVDFKTISQSTICINTLQGYRFDKNDVLGLRLSYGISRNR